jgi:hypothetical protein
MKNYSIADLLVGTYYRPTSFNRKPLAGVINYAEKRGNIYVGENADAYAIRFRPDGSILDYWATITVSHAD